MFTYPGKSRHSLLYDARPDRHLAVRVRTWNIGSLGEIGEFCEELQKRM